MVKNRDDFDRRLVARVRGATNPRVKRSGGEVVEVDDGHNVVVEGTLP